MNKKLVHTPEGVRDIYGLENARKLEVERLLDRQFSAFGYHNIQTPTFEFFDVFSKEIGTKPSRDLYKFFDKEGNTLVLRPDFTPSIARCNAKYFMDEDIPARFSYTGNTFANTSDLQGKLKELTQTGVEYIGDGSVEADAELITLAVRTLLASGLKEFQISIGEIDFFKGLCEEAGLDRETELEVREQISIKNYFGVEEILAGKQLSKEKTDVFLKVTELFGSYDCLEEAEGLVHNERSKNACRRLHTLYDLLCLTGSEKYISFDMGMVSKYNYYTGVIFKAYTYGVGDVILTGGRYDDLLTYFGKNAPAIGFAIVVDDLMIALNSQKLHPAVSMDNLMLCYDRAQYREALKLADTLRKEQKKVAMYARQPDKDRNDYLEFAKSNLTNEVWFLMADGTIEKERVED